MDSSEKSEERYKKSIASKDILGGREIMGIKIYSKRNNEWTEHKMFMRKENYMHMLIYSLTMATNVFFVHSKRDLMTNEHSYYYYVEKQQVQRTSRQAG